MLTVNVLLSPYFPMGFNSKKIMWNTSPRKIPRLQVTWCHLLSWKWHESSKCYRIARPVKCNFCYNCDECHEERDHNDWRNALRRVRRLRCGKKMTPLREMIKKLPDIAEDVLDMCITNNNDKQVDYVDFENKIIFEFAKNGNGLLI